MDWSALVDTATKAVTGGGGGGGGGGCGGCTLCLEASLAALVRRVVG